MAERKRGERKPRGRYGIGEWYGHSFIRLAPSDRKRLASIQAIEKKDRAKIPCPFRSTAGNEVWCTKEGGVCSLRLYQQAPGTQVVVQAGPLVATCPYRFQQNGTIYRWIGETLLGHSGPVIVGEVGFLKQDVAASSGESEDVGRIDNVLVHPTHEPMSWCALEIQAVYFSGASMSKEFRMLRTLMTRALPLPAAHRRPDYRSSGPKRLMPQLQIKVPTLRRWGKKMAVVVDRSFYEALGEMDDVKDVSNCDIAWFVVAFEESDGEPVLRRDFVRLTTLERAVEGLTGGHAVSLEEFETRIRQKLAEKNSPSAAIPDSGQ